MRLALLTGPSSSTTIPTARAAEATAEDIRRAGAQALLVKADAGTPEGCGELATAIADAGERAEMLVHCAVDAYAVPCMEADPQRFAQAVTTNSISLLYLVQAFDDLLDHGSTVFFFSSRGGKIVVTNYAAIGVGKAATEALIRYLATELAPRGIRVNSVAPSLVATDAVRKVFGEAATESLMEHASKGQSQWSRRGACRLLRIDPLPRVTGGILHHRPGRVCEWWIEPLGVMGTP